MRPTDRRDAALDDYRRGTVPLRSGDQAWVYVFRRIYQRLS
jgi:hypothetical protein